MQNDFQKFKGIVWCYKGKSSWHFVSINQEISQQIRNILLFKPKGFGSIPVIVTVGETKWQTSIFPDKNKTYLLPLKKSVRIKENLTEGKTYVFKVSPLI